ncbi:MAG: class I SAM-dependent methyltransferase [bacterium]|nr:class I SAM-dependent methyltransferase [bacterium]
MKRIDLEDLAAGYGYRPPSPEALARANRAADSAGLSAGDLAIDIGGGRGSHAAVWAQRDAVALVIDPARGMSHVAAKRPGVMAIRAPAQHLPIKSGTAQLVYFHLSLHYGDWRAAVDEAWRVLAPEGECWIWTMGEEHHRGSFLAEWFPSVGDIDTARFPDPAEVVANLERGWTTAETGKDIEKKVTAAGIWRTAVENRFISTLQLIPDYEFRAGMANYDDTYPDPDEPVEYLLTFDWIRACK